MEDMLGLWTDSSELPLYLDPKNPVIKHPQQKIPVGQIILIILLTLLFNLAMPGFSLLFSRYSFFSTWRF